MNFLTCLAVISLKCYVRNMTLLMFVLLLASVKMFPVNKFLFSLHLLCRCLFASCFYCAAGIMANEDIFIAL